MTDVKAVVRVKHPDIVLTETVTHDRSATVTSVSEAGTDPNSGKFFYHIESADFDRFEAGLDNAAAFFDLGLLHTQEGKLETALRHFQRAVKHPDYALAARLLWGESLKKLGRMRDSAIQYMEALRLADSMLVEPDQSHVLQQLYEPMIEALAQEKDENTDTYEDECRSEEPVERP